MPRIAQRRHLLQASRPTKTTQCYEICYRLRSTSHDSQRNPPCAQTWHAQDDLFQSPYELPSKSPEEPSDGTMRKDTLLSSPLLLSSLPPKTERLTRPTRNSTRNTVTSPVTSWPNPTKNYRNRPAASVTTPVTVPAGKPSPKKKRHHPRRGARASFVTQIRQKQERPPLKKPSKQRHSSPCVSKSVTNSPIPYPPHTEGHKTDHHMTPRETGPGGLAAGPVPFLFPSYAQTQSHSPIYSPSQLPLTRWMSRLREPWTLPARGQSPRTEKII